MIKRHPLCYVSLLSAVADAAKCGVVAVDPAMHRSMTGRTGASWAENVTANFREFGLGEPLGKQGGGGLKTPSPLLWHDATKSPHGSDGSVAGGRLAGG